MKQEIVNVVFRKWPNGDVIALFPEIPAGTRGLSCLSYEHIGQHGATDYDNVVSATRPSTMEELTPLNTELQRIGYLTRLCWQRTPQMRANYKTALTKIRGD